MFGEDNRGKIKGRFHRNNWASCMGNKRGLCRKTKRLTGKKIRRYLRRDLSERTWYAN